MNIKRIIEIMLSKIEKTDTCWLWQGWVYQSGCPGFVIDGKQLSARKYCALLKSLPVPTSRTFVWCGNPNCVNPDHIIAGDLARFWSKVHKFSDEKGGCWVWTGGEDKNGYGKFCYYLNGNQIDVRAHRYSWELRWGSISSPIAMVCHKCDNPRCVNPNHLFLGDAADNAHDRDIKGRANSPKGSRNALSVLTEDDVLEIRNSSKKNKELALIYNVHAETIRRIRAREIWKHVA